jgi:[acyl-carrier-protein] S-malonyltransferase/trans-AT polyketide synthase/acyltransferase/oxidoreductase domain-containing protein
MATPTTTIVFPGQGTQRAGMGQDFHSWSTAARDVYAEASDALGLDLCALCFADDERLGLTELAQPAILATEIAMLRAIETELGLSASTYGGHSLGEYTALVACGALPLASAVRLVRERGRLMQDAVPVGRGGMTAVIGDALDAAAIADALDGLTVAIANDNAASQLVLSGLSTDLPRARLRIAALPGHERVRFVDLPVSAPFHSPLMAGIAPAYESALDGARATLDPGPAADVTCNYTGEFHDADADAIVDRLIRQIAGTVRWRDNMAAIARRGGRVIEIGPGRPLRGFLKTVGIDAATITDVRSATRVATAELAR